MKNKIIVVLTGEIGSGKTSLAQNLVKSFNFTILKTRDALFYYSKDFRRKTHEDDRMFLQRVGEAMDKKTSGKWVVDYFQKEILNTNRIIIDSVRIAEQIEAFRKSYGYQNVIQIHVNASEETLEKRHFERNNLPFDDLKAMLEYKTYKQNATEMGVRNLIADADLVIDTDKFSINDNVVRVASFLRLFPSIHNQLVDVVIGGQFGSEGKGQICAFLAPEYDCLLRVGGPNAGHKVFENPTPDTFHLIPSGTRRAQNAKILIGPGTIISLDVISREIDEFCLTPDRLVIDENAVIITDSDKKAEEKIDKIGSTKQGVGAATASNLFQHRLKKSDKHKAKNNKYLKQFIGQTHAELENLFSKNSKILLEGTQGTLLSLHHGIYPYVTSRDTSVSGCISEAGISPKRIRKIIMVTRRYPIRVDNPNGGTSGPFSRDNNNIELDFKTIADSSGIPLSEITDTEKTSTTHRKRRIAEFNWALFRESCELNSPTDIALTFADYIDIKNRMTRRYDQLTKETTKFIDEIERCGGIPVSLIATNFNYRSIIDRRNWI